MRLLTKVNRLDVEQAKANFWDPSA